MYTFRKNERLCSRKLIDDLYRSGKRFTVFPLTVQWKVCSAEANEPPAQVLVIAPKRKLKHAVDRNHMKRLIRESYRQRKHTLYETLEAKGKRLIFAIAYSHHELFSYASIDKKMERIIDKLNSQIGETDSLY